jgi:acyl phosphate:glycerol-3-phosphate acyltransferase
MSDFVPFLVLSYLIGSIPTAYWYGKFIHKVDIRELGSGNSGATNSLRVLGKKAGITVLLIDIVKGLTIILLTRFLGFNLEDQFLIGLGAVIGHLLPIFAQFKGGKGIATSFGLIIGISPYGAIICVLVFVIVVKFTKYVSLGSLLGAFSFIIFSFFKFPDSLFLQLTCLVLFLILCFTHRANISRLIKGVENEYPPKK